MIRPVSGRSPPGRAGTGARRIGLLAFVFLLGVPPGVRAANLAEPAVGDSAAVARSPEDDRLLDDLQRRAFRFFVEQADLRTGLVRDRARADGTPSAGKASIAASGFALSAWVIAAQRGWVSRAAAVAQTRKALHFLAERAPRRHGFFYHFMEMDTGQRAWDCEVSPIDTGLFFAGAILARQYYSDPEITGLVDRLMQGVDWEWFLNAGPTLAMSWTDEEGFSRFRWDHYSEAMLLSFLGMGATAQPLPMSHWNAWLREPVGTYAGDHFIEGAPLFIHQYTHAYVDLRGRRDAYADYYHNSVLATRAQRRFCHDLSWEFPAWDDRLWGLTSSDSDNGYRAWGGPPRTFGPNSLDGTLVPCAVAGSLTFDPDAAMATLRTMRTVYGDRIWRRYGFVDAFNPITGWVDTDVIGIDLGITLLQAENARTGLIWSVFMQAPEVRRALLRAGFLTQRRELTRDERDAWRSVAIQTWQAIESGPVGPDSTGVALSAILGAQALGLIDAPEAQRRLDAVLRRAVAPLTEHGWAMYAAGLVAVRQAVPALAAEATRRLAAIDWRNLRIDSNALGSASRLAVFFQVASGARPAAAWANLSRTAEAQGQVQVLEPAQVFGQLMPGLWLDERSIVTGASAAQLAYAMVIARRLTSTATFPYAVADTALVLEHFPVEVGTSLRSTRLPSGWLQSALPINRYLLFLSLANLLAHDCLRGWFQQDPLVQAGRAALPEFALAAFGPHDSVYTRNELALPEPVPPERSTIVVRTTVPRERWPWIEVKGLQYKCSDADVRPGDPDLELRFALTWDSAALHFHAVVMDTPPGFASPTGYRAVVLYINPKRNGLEWFGPDDFAFSYQPDGSAVEWFHDRPITAQVHPAVGGYVVEASIPWRVLGMTPRPGLTFDLTAGVTAAGVRESDPSLELSWRTYNRPDDRLGLGTARLVW
jgi:hypothetical protein